MSAGLSADQGATAMRPPPVVDDSSNPITESTPTGAAVPAYDPNNLIFKNKFRIYFTRSLPEFKTIGADAYEAEEIGGAGRKCVAHVCYPRFPLRYQAIKTLQGVSLPSCMNLLDSGTSEWPNQPDRRLILITLRPMGKRYTGVNSPTFPKMSEQDIIHLVAQPLVQALRQAHDRHITLRNICIYNLFWSDSSQQSLMLQEFYTEPPAYRQPAVAETIVNAMCDPAARGDGTAADDIFALGVLILMLAIGRTPAADHDHTQHLLQRMDYGSFETLLGKYAISANLLDALRGMLVDDSVHAWQLGDVEAWLKGSRQAVKAARPQRRASRGLDFMEKSYGQLDMLCLAFAQNWAKAAALIRAKDLDSWLRRALADEPLADMVLKVTGGKNGAPRNIPDEHLVAKTIAILNPSGPICYQNLIVKIDGFGYALALANAQQQQDKLQALIQCLVNRIPQLWLNALPDEQKKLHNKALGYFEAIPNIIEARGPGFGLERVLYMLNPGMPCQSDLLKNEPVVHPSEILPVLEKLAATSQRPQLPVDRHIAAYFGAWVAEIKDGDLRPLAPPADINMQILAILYLLGKIQRVYKIRELPHLTNWCAELIRPTLVRFKNVARRQRITDQVQARVKSGQLFELAKCADNDEEYQRDHIGFEHAALEHAALSLRIANLQNMRQRQHEIAALRGERAAVVLAGFMAVAYLLLFFYWRMREVLHG